MADQPIRVASGQPYGAAKAQADAQRVAPLPEMPVVPLNAPSMRPNEHVMSGVNAGPGPGAAEAGVIGYEQNGDDILNTLRGLYQKYPLPGIAAAISDYAQHPPWSFDDLTIDLVDQATRAAQIAERNRRFDELAGIGKARLPRPTRLEQPATREPGGMFDPAAPLDPSQVDDQRVSTGLGLGAAGAAFGAELAPTPDQPEQLQMKGPR